MKLLVTPALCLTEAQKACLRSQHTLFELSDERIPLAEQTLSFDPAEIEGIICNFFFQYNSLDSLPSLKVIQLTSAGLDRVPLEEIRARGIKLFNAGSAYAVPMAEWAVSKVLEITKSTAFFYRNQQEGEWNKHRGIRELHGMTAAIVGFGNVGRAIAARLAPFGVRIVAVDVCPPPEGLCDAYYDISCLNEALSCADIVVLTLPLTAQTRHILNADRLALMKDDAVLINIARGGLVDEQALLDTLQAGRLYGVASDVFEQEPLPKEHPFWTCERMWISPHNSFVGNGNAARLFAFVNENLSAFSNNGIKE